MKRQRTQTGRTSADASFQQQFDCRATVFIMFLLFNGFIFFFYSTKTYIGIIKT